MDSGWAGNAGNGPASVQVHGHQESRARRHQRNRSSVPSADSAGPTAVFSAVERHSPNIQLKVQVTLLCPHACVWEVASRTPGGGVCLGSGAKAPEGTIPAPSH